MSSSSRSAAEHPGPQAGDARLPFARGEDRLRLLYTLPLTDAPACTLLVGADDGAARALRSGWASAVTQWSASALVEGLRGADAPSYDAVLLPGLLRAGAPAPAAIVRSALAALRPGGVLVGHAPNLLSAHALRGARHGPLPLPWSAWATPARVERSLRRHGCVDAEAFFVEPRVASPMVLVPAARAAARRHFLIAVRRNRPLYGSAGYLLRLALAGCGLGGMLQPEIFFWARKPC